MPRLYLHSKPIESIFELLGSDENDITYSVGWALHSSPGFLRQFLGETLQYEGSLDDVTIRLQEYRRTKGITDIEIRKPGEFHVIVEAKKGWSVPGVRQLRRYAARLRNDRHRTRRILVLSECSAKYAEDHLACRNARGIPVQPISWKTVADVASRAISKGNHREKRLLREMLSYLGRVVTVQDIESNWVYVVSLDPEGMEKVRRRKQYSHPVGVHKWPKQPLNYIAFRYHGRVQSIHHVDNYKQTTHDHGVGPPTRPKKGTPYFLYKLGPAIVPSREVGTGRIWRSGRVRCFWDTLFTCKTISDARDLSEKRRRMAERLSG